MTLAHLTYRLLQFYKYLGSRPTSTQLSLASQILSASQMKLFQRMQPGEQMHSLEVLQKLMEQEEPPLDLQVAALLHDVGKICVQLNIVERAMIVIVKAVLPYWAKRWGKATDPSRLSRWKQAFLVAEQHPQWGADLALAAGVSCRTANLIRRHQETVISVDNEEDFLLQKLQSADGNC